MAKSPRMKKDKKQEQEHKTKENRLRAETSREKRKEELGSPFTINMHDENKKRLREICVHFGHEDMKTREKATGKFFSQTIMNVVDYYYITVIITPKNNSTKSLINAFKAVWKLCTSQNNTFILKKDFESLKNKKAKKTIEDILQLIANKMTKRKHHIPPYLINNKFDERDINKWTPKDVLYLLDTQNVISKIDRMEQ
ncbi:TPA: hypothetical protein RG734_000656 [Providencia stuartii]|nr:hypothetical protein [Providencia stuartii]